MDYGCDDIGSFRQREYNINDISQRKCNINEIIVSETWDYNDMWKSVGYLSSSYIKFLSPTNNSNIKNSFITIITNIVLLHTYLHNQIFFIMKFELQLGLYF